MRKLCFIFLVFLLVCNPFSRNFTNTAITGTIITTPTRDTITLSSKQSDTVVRIIEISPNNTNSLGGSDLNISWQNKSSRSITSITFYTYAYDEKGDIITSDYDDKREAVLTTKGYIKSDSVILWGSSWGSVWYSFDLKDVKIHKIVVTFSDGKTIIIL